MIGVYRVLVTAAASPFPSAVAERLLDRPDVESVVMVDTEAPDPLPNTTVIGLGASYGQLRDVIGDHGIDTVIHGALSSDRLGGTGSSHDADVIDTLHVAAVAADLAGPVRKIVALSSTARYEAGPESAQFRHEHEVFTPPRDGSYAASLAEAEEYLVALADQRPNLTISILRLADLAGPKMTSPLSAMLRRPMAPLYFGFDPMVQFLHVDDALDAVEHAVQEDLAGTYNVASRGHIEWSRSIRLSRTAAVPILPPTLDPLTPFWQLVGGGIVPPGLAKTLQFGRVASTDRLKATGYVASHTVDDCVRLLRPSGPKPAVRRLAPARSVRH